MIASSPTCSQAEPTTAYCLLPTAHCPMPFTSPLTDLTMNIASLRDRLTLEQPHPHARRRRRRIRHLGARRRAVGARAPHLRR